MRIPWTFSLAFAVAFTNSALSYGAPNLTVRSNAVNLTDDASADISIANTGDSDLSWSMSTPAAWLFFQRLALSQHPVGTDSSVSVIKPGETFSARIHAETGGLPVGHYQATLRITSNGGTKDVAVSLNVQHVNLSGRWTGSLEMLGSSALTFGVSIDITQVGFLVNGKIDGRESPALATTLKRQATKVTFSPSSAVTTLGAMRIIAVDERQIAESWTLIAQMESGRRQTFAVVASNTGAQAEATVGVPYFSAAGGISFVILPTLNDVPYTPGDKFSFAVGHYGAVPELLTGTTNELSGTAELDGGWLQVPVGTKRSIRMFQITLQSPSLLTALVEIGYKGASNGGLDAVSRGRLTLRRE